MLGLSSGGKWSLISAPDTKANEQRAEYGRMKLEGLPNGIVEVRFQYSDSKIKRLTAKETPKAKPQTTAKSKSRND